MQFPIQTLLNLPLPLSSSLTGERANCFNAVQAYFDDAVDLRFLGPEEFVAYLHAKFVQVQLPGDVQVVWSRSSPTLLEGRIRVELLRKSEPGYPFGLVIEHAFVFITPSEVFQKLDPSPKGPYQIVGWNEAVRPYLASNGFELTTHRRL